jgi:multisubunit Na+/H+ antiporter MnhB subunit
MSKIMMWEGFLLCQMVIIGTAVVLVMCIIRRDRVEMSPNWASTLAIALFVGAAIAAWIN